MIYRDFQGMELSGLGFGMMRLPVVDGNDASVDEAETEKMIARAIENGINYFDTAWGYHGGNSELMVGKFLSKYPRDSYFLADKFPGYDNSNMPKVKEIFEKQLEKCNTPYFDFYLFHNVCEGNIDDYLEPGFGILEYLLEQKENGRIRHLGFSCHGAIDVLKRFCDAYGGHMEFCQLQINYMDWHFQKCEEKAAFCKERNIPVWAMEPLRGGKLCSIPEHMVSELRAMRPEEGVPAWAFRFLQSVPEVAVVLSGMSSMEQLEENISIWAEDKPLSETEFGRLVSLIDEENNKNGLPCTACRYCTDHCPKNLPIPELIALYNEHMSTRGSMSFLAPMAVGSMEEGERPSNCIACKSCEQVCPQQIKISDAMKSFSEMLGM